MNSVGSIRREDFGYMEREVGRHFVTWRGRWVVEGRYGGEVIWRGGRREIWRGSR